PFEKIVAELNPERDLSRQPLFQVDFTFQNLTRAELELPGLKLKPMVGEHVTSMFDLTINLMPGPSGVHGNVEYATDLFNGVTIERLVSHWMRLLEEAVAHPESGVWELPLLSEGERRQLLVEWNQTERPYPSERSIAELFEEQAARHPEKIALVHGSSVVSY